MGRLDEDRYEERSYGEVRRRTSRGSLIDLSSSRFEIGEGSNGGGCRGSGVGERSLKHSIYERGGSRCLKPKRGVKEELGAGEVGRGFNEEGALTRGSKAEKGNCRKSSRHSRFEAKRGKGNPAPPAFTAGRNEESIQESSGDRSLEAARAKETSVLPVFTAGGKVVESAPASSPPHQAKLSYKDMLTRSPPLQAPTAKLRARRAWLDFRKSGRCYRCLALDHSVAECRDPVRCLACRKVGHRASQCALRPCRAPGQQAASMDRVLRRRTRPHTMKAYIPYTEELLRRAELKRNALLADVVQPADLGPNPQHTLADALARRFGGYSHDFFVTRFSERDFAIILPGWVSADTLIRRHLITLEATWLRCYAWGPHRNARHHRSRYTAWIILRNVPFECWTPARIASMISGFGRFIRADDASKTMTDLRAYRCRIAIEDVLEIPRRLAIVLGDEVVEISVHVESSELVRDAGEVQQPLPPQPPIAAAPGGGDGRLAVGAPGLAGVEGGGEGGGAVDAASVAGDNSGISMFRVPGRLPRDDETPLPHPGRTSPESASAVGLGGGASVGGAGFGVHRRRSIPTPGSFSEGGRGGSRGRGRSCRTANGRRALRRWVRVDAVESRGPRSLSQEASAGIGPSVGGPACPSLPSRGGGGSRWSSGQKVI